MTFAEMARFVAAQLLAAALAAAFLYLALPAVALPAERPALQCVPLDAARAIERNAGRAVVGFGPVAGGGGAGLAVFADAAGNWVALLLLPDAEAACPVANGTGWFVAPLPQLRGAPS